MFHWTDHLVLTCHTTINKINDFQVNHRHLEHYLTNMVLFFLSFNSLDLSIYNVAPSSMIYVQMFDNWLDGSICWKKYKLIFNRILTLLTKVDQTVIRLQCFMKLVQKRLQLVVYYLNQDGSYLRGHVIQRLFIPQDYNSNKHIW